MKTNPNDLAFPISADVEIKDVNINGLTKREYFAAMAMQGCMNKEDPNATVGWNERRPQQIANYALRCADALISELNKDKK